MRSLNPIQQRVLAEITLDCRCSVREVAKKLKVKTHTVRYAIEQLNATLKMEPFCFTNPFSMGLTTFRIYFSANTADKRKVTQMLEHIRSLPEMGWLYSLHGTYQFGMSLRVPNMQALNRILVDFDAKFGDLVINKCISTLARFAYYQPALAHLGSGPRSVFEYTSDDELVVLDATDLKLLTAIKGNAAAPVRELAQVSGLPSSTVAYRLDRLVKNRVILGFAYTYEDFLGSASFLIQVAIRGLGGRTIERLFDFARGHPRVNWAAKTIGVWDFEMEVALNGGAELEAIVGHIYRFGEGQVREVITHTWGADFLS
jgi:DNA-binding Lrp family transcriptional regulator